MLDNFIFFWELLRCGRAEDHRSKYTWSRSKMYDLKNRKGQNLELPVEPWAIGWFQIRYLHFWISNVFSILFDGPITTASTNTSTTTASISTTATTINNDNKIHHWFWLNNKRIKIRLMYYGFCFDILNYRTDVKAWALWLAIIT